MKFPPAPRTPYILDKEQDKRIYEKLAQFKDKKLTTEQEKLIIFLYTQLEDDWRTPLEEFIDKFLQDTANMQS